MMRRKINSAYGVVIHKLHLGIKLFLRHTQALNSVDNDDKESAEFELVY